MSGPFECAIFDCDGTLVDSESLQCELLSAHLLRRGIDVGLEALIDAYRGWRLNDVVADLSQRFSIDFGSAFVPEFRAEELRAVQTSLAAIPGVRSALERIPIPKCVASGSPSAKIHGALDATGLAAFFGEHIFSSDDIQSWKPDPGLFLHAAQRMGVPPRRCIVVEDSSVGVRAALRAGMVVIQYAPLGVEPEPGAAVIEHMDSLPRLICG